MNSVQPVNRPVEAKNQARTKGAIAKNPVIALWSTTIGKKIVMAVTGAVLVLFVIAHMLGNLKMFAGAAEIDAYARFLREVGMPELGYGDLLWVVRAVLFVCVVLHILAAYQLTRLSHAARPAGYARKKDIHTSYAALLMRWGGVLIAIFVIFHILHFTLGDVGFAPGQYVELGVYHNAMIAFHIWWITLFYIVAMAALGLHLDHGIWSGFQTLGWATVKNTKALRAFSRVIAILVFLGFISVPIGVAAGWLH